ncbi:4-hydroxythreonine-4-phosphate dehydrogenase PdxA [Marinomonas sp. 15G1-11]|uniref:4-hydroxythreonine-4-phosphate dehydrogenase n=1 Tax=Marinomonas phaeophyticola TaxID=3004091 RepID=A0ABT4JS27_9GAMM|nr:4-hydroxythreonine-4-phosphate dehydrogenase PdxA [Marinomonas sp. 15G1-11]MCZ2721162.1 4-hydroxythreonine-4-phosphate dehydrogenase PdxA [Marinomonas sp. 15G1-11]
MTLPIIAITSGEPAGIGPDIILSALQKTFMGRLVVLADPSLLAARAEELGIKANIHIIENIASLPKHVGGTIYVQPIGLAHTVTTGKLDVANAPYVLETLQVAGTKCLAGTFDAIVTPPVHKGVLCETGVHFSGHTEFFQQLTESEQVVMMLATPSLRVALATTHLPLKDVAKAITKTGLTQVIRALQQELINKFALPNPKILVCGLNPHAGEDGHLGREEIEIITPTLDALRNEGMDLIGPLPADTLFTPKYLNHCDCVLAMYHDQGLPVLKYQGFGNAVNITLGLPIIRTSVDHGTALDLAGSGNANHGSLEVAINYAIDMANNSKKVS